LWSGEKNETNEESINHGKKMQLRDTIMGHNIIDRSGIQRPRKTDDVTRVAGRHGATVAGVVQRRKTI
jgi:hypothetical protein